MVQSPSWEANWFAASQEIPCISRNPKVHCRTHKRPPPISILGQPNPVHIHTSHLLVLMTVVIKTVMTSVHRLKSCFHAYMLACLHACLLAWLPALSRLHWLTHENLPSLFRCVCKILYFGIEILWSTFVWQAQSCFCVIVMLLFLLIICSGWVLFLFVLFIYITVYLCSYFATLKHKYFVTLWHA